MDEQEELKRIKKQVETRCNCGHNELTHIHFNGDYLPEGIPTYCGHPSKVGEEYVYCECDKFTATEIHCQNCQHHIRIRSSSLCGLTYRPALSALTEGVTFNHATWERQNGACGKEAKLFQSKEKPNGEQTNDQPN